METLLQKDYALVSYNPEKKFIILHFIKEINLEKYKAVLNEVLPKITEKKTLRLIVDQRYVEQIGMEERAWLVSQWLPGLLKIAGSRFKIGIVSSSNLYSRMGNEYIVNSIKNLSNFEAEVLFSMDNAIKWISD